jgi:hypothetical protein
MGGACLCGSKMQQHCKKRMGPWVLSSNSLRVFVCHVTPNPFVLCVTWHDQTVRSAANKDNRKSTNGDQSHVEDLDIRCKRLAVRHVF